MFHDSEDDEMFFLFSTKNLEMLLDSETHF